MLMTTTTTRDDGGCGNCGVAVTAPSLRGAAVAEGEDDDEEAAAEGLKIKILAHGGDGGGFDGGSGMAVVLRAGDSCVGMVTANAAAAMTTARRQTAVVAGRTRSREFGEGGEVAMGIRRASRKARCSGRGAAAAAAPAADVLDLAIREQVVGELRAGGCAIGKRPDADVGAVQEGAAGRR
jgi:pyruvate/2-oxoacid:ferredoxin oxidoreductase beta subunit